MKCVTTGWMYYKEKNHLDNMSKNRRGKKLSQEELQEVEDFVYKKNIEDW
jgi:hypothetical protein